jgi:hypothetical protein
MKCLWIAASVSILIGCGGSSGGKTSDSGTGSDGGPGNPGDGGAAGLSFSPEPLVIGTAPGTPASARLTLTNPGASASTVTALSISGDQAGSFQVAPAAALPLNVAPGGTATMTITFNSASVGPAHAILTATGQGGTLAQAHLGALAFSDEPSLQWILDANWIPISVGSPDPTTKVMPTTPRLGDELGIQAFVKAGSGPVTLQLIGAFGPPFVDPMAIAGWYPTGMASGETPLFTLAKSQARVMNPQPNAGAQLSFDPGTGPFGFWSTWPYWGTYHVFQEDVFNTWDPPPQGVLHHMRVYPFKDPDGTLEPNAFVVVTEEADVKVGAVDYNDLIQIVRNVSPAPGMIGSLRFDNLDVVPASDWMVFSTFGSIPACQQPLSEKNTGTLRIQNLGNAAINISTVTTTDAFAAAPAQPLPATIGPGASLDVAITFIATSDRLHRGMLTVNTSDPAAPTHTVTLSGVFQVHPQQPGEPRPDQIFNGIFGFTTTILGPGQDCYVLNLDDPQCGGRVQAPGFEIALGDEVLSAYWAKADATRPVAVQEIGSWHSGYDCPNQVSYGSSFGWWAKGMPPMSSTQWTLSGAVEDVQRVLPRTHDHSGPSYTTFDPGGTVMGFRIENELSDDSLQEQEPWCTPTDKCGHRMRFWPVKNSHGTPVPNSYVVTIDWHVSDFSTSNYDYQDEVYLLDNIRPVDVISGADAGTPIAPLGGGS